MTAGEVLRAAGRSRLRLRILASRARGRGLPLVSAALSFYAAVTVIPLLYVASWAASRVLGHERFSRSAYELADLLGLGSVGDRAAAAVERGGVSSLVFALLISALYGEGFARAGRALDATQWRGTPVVRARLMFLPVSVVFTLVLTVGLLVLDVYAGGRPLTPVGALDGYLIFLAVWVGATFVIAACYACLAPPHVGAAATLLAAAAAGSWVSGSAIGYRLVTALPLDLGGPFFGYAAVGAAVLICSWLFLAHLAIAGGWLALQVLADRKAPARPSGETPDAKRPTTRGAATSGRRHMG